MRKIPVIILLSISFFRLSAQSSFKPFNFDDEGELRTNLYQKIRLNDRYSLSLDEGLYIGMGNNIWTRWGFRASIARKLNNSLTIDLGAMYNHISYETKTSQEFRLHQSFSFSYPQLKHSAIKHRFRLEERIQSYNTTIKNTFKTRLRYRISHKSSFRKKAIEPKNLYYSLSSEWNINIYNETPGKLPLRGRYGAGLGYQFNPTISTDLTYYFQHDAKAHTNQLKTSHLSQLSLRYNIK